MKKKTKITIYMIGLFLVIAAVLALTYAFFSTRFFKNTNTSIIAETKNLSLTYANEDPNPGIITVTKLKPNTVVGTKTFSVTNNGDDTNYSVIVDSVSITSLKTGESTTFNSNDFRYDLTCSSSDNVICNSKEAEVLPLEDAILVSNSIARGAKHSYTLTITYIETGVNQASDMNKKLEAKINISEGVSANPYYSNKSSLAYIIIKNAELNLNGTEFSETPLTTPGESTSGLRYLDGGLGTETNKNITGTNYVTYGDSYEFNDQTGKYTIVNKDGSPLSAIQYNSGYNSVLIGKYIGSYYGSSSSSPQTGNSYTANKDYIYIVTDNSTSTNIYYKDIRKSSNVLSTESVLSVADDDYTSTTGNKSYYFRGGVEDNYIDFAGMCWRIVRIEGDGSVKLILEDQDSTCVNSNGNWNIPTTTNGSTLTGNFGSSTHATGTLTASNGTTNSDYRWLKNYLNPTYVGNTSMATAFKNFQTGRLTSLISNNYSGASLNDFLKIDDWCMNDKGYSQSGSNPNYTYTELSNTEMLDRIVQNTSFYYDSSVRLAASSVIPLLRCNGTVMNKFGDNTTDMYVGTLTADEIVYAGGRVYTSNNTYYLINDYQKTNNLYFWSLSPRMYNFNNKRDYAFDVTPSGSIDSDYVSKDSTNNVGTINSFRPSITLKPGINISGGVGTKSNPYVVS